MKLPQMRQSSFFLLHHSFSPLNAHPSLFSASYFSVLSPFVHFETSHRWWRELQPVLPSPRLILANSVCFAFLISFCPSLLEEKTPVRRSTRLPLSYIFFSLSRSECIPCISNKWSPCLWFETCLNFDSWKNIQRNVFFRFCRKIHQKNPCSLWWIHFFVHIYIYIYIYVAAFYTFEWFW